MEMTIQERITGYRKSTEEWIRRRNEALRQADECLGKIHACNGAIEALEAMLPAVPVEDVIHAIGGDK